MGFFAKLYSVTIATPRWHGQTQNDSAPAFAMTAIDPRGSGFEYAFNKRGELEQIFVIRTTRAGQQLLAPVSPEDAPPPASAILRALSAAHQW